MIHSADRKVCKVFINPIQTQLLTRLVTGVLGLVLCPRIIQMKKRSWPLNICPSLLQIKGRHTVWHHIAITHWSISAWHPNFERYRRPMIWPPCSWSTTTLIDHASLAGRWLLCKSSSSILRKEIDKSSFSPSPPFEVRKEVHQLIAKCLGKPPAEGIPLCATALLKVPWVKSVCPTADEMTEAYLRWKCSKSCQQSLLASLKLILTSSGTSCGTIHETEKIMQDGVLSEIAGVIPQICYWYICI